MRLWIAAAFLGLTGLLPAAEPALSPLVINYLELTGAQAEAVAASAALLHADLAALAAEIDAVGEEITAATRRASPSAAEIGGLVVRRVTLDRERSRRPLGGLAAQAVLTPPQLARLAMLGVALEDNRYGCAAISRRLIAATSAEQNTWCPVQLSLNLGAKAPGPTLDQLLGLSAAQQAALRRSREEAWAGYDFMVAEYTGLAISTATAAPVPDAATLGYLYRQLAETNRDYDRRVAAEVAGNRLVLRPDQTLRLDELRGALVLSETACAAAKAGLLIEPRAINYDSIWGEPYSLDQGVCGTPLSGLAIASASGVN